jgi:poly(glycerol-phosphate) alpha-glucosyltransferase
VLLFLGRFHPKKGIGPLLEALEAMAWRLPALLSPACNLPEAFVAGAAWPVAADGAQLVVGLRRLLAAGDQELAQLGEAGERPEVLQP